MSINIRYPEITSPSDAEKLKQMQSFMYQLVDQLNWALNSVVDSQTEAPYEARGMAAQSPQPETTSPLGTFNSIKGLIIKSAEIVTAYYEKIDGLLALSGHYVAQSDFGTFKEETNDTISGTDKQLRQDLVSKQSIFDEKGNIRAELLVNGHIYSGIIEYAKDGEAIVGIEIGQTTMANGSEKFNRFARFTAEKLAFYSSVSPDEPVAYISGKKLYITEVEIEGSFIEGGYEDTISADGGIVTKWKGVQ